MPDTKIIPIVENKKSNVPLANHSSQDTDLTRQIKYTRNEFDEDIANLADDIEACAAKAMQKWSKEKAKEVLQNTSRAGLNDAVKELKEKKEETDKIITTRKNMAIDDLADAKRDVDSAMPTAATTTVSDINKISEGRDKVIEAKHNFSNAAQAASRNYGCTYNKDEITNDTENIQKGAEVVAYNLVPPDEQKSSTRYNRFNIKDEDEKRKKPSRHQRSVNYDAAGSDVNDAANDAFKPDEAILSAVRSPF